MASRHALTVLALAFLLSGCAAPSASPMPSEERARTYQEFADRACDAFGSLFVAIGNPDTGGDSELTAALEAAAAARDVGRAEEMAALIRAELARGREHARLAAGWAPGAAMMDALADLLTAFDASVDISVAMAHGDASEPERQRAFEAAGGLEAWNAMFAAAQQVADGRPPGVPATSCSGLPVSL